MAVIRAVATLVNDTGLPRDSAVNRFHFDTASSPASDAQLDAIELKMNNFYQSVDQWLSVELTGAWTITMYDMGDPEPRVPVRQVAGAALTPNTGSAYPNEVSIVCSFQAEPASGEPQARRRNRIYLGPLGVNTGETGVGDVFVASLTRTELATAMDTIMGAVDINQWVVRSETTGAIAPVDNGWIDNTFDTQRRRGLRTTARTTWSI